MRCLTTFLACRFEVEGRMATATRLFAVTLSHGPRWETSQPLEGQKGWVEHASFMDALVAEGFVVLGGPLEVLPARCSLFAPRAPTTSTLDSPRTPGPDSISCGPRR